MEALTYDRALAFKELIPPEEFRTWQPRKLMGALLEIDPLIGMTTTTVSIGPEGMQNPEKMITLGTDFALTLKDLKFHYDALGSYLRIPSLEQIQSGNLPDPLRLRERCEELGSKLNKCIER
jgi:hypothetical protein